MLTIVYMCAMAATPAPSPDVKIQFEPRTRGYFMNVFRNISEQWLELEVQRIHEAGFNVILFPVYNNGWTLFPSEAMRSRGLPALNPALKKWNPLALLVELAESAGLSVWAFARPYDFHPRYSMAEHRLLKKYPSWRMRGHLAFQGGSLKKLEQWHPCPTHLDYQRFLGDVLTEVSAAYPVSGLMINYTGLGLRGGTLEDWPFCFCDNCCQRYYKFAEGDLVSDASRGRIDAIRSWQMDQVREHLVYLRHRISRIRPGLRLICRATPHWREHSKCSVRSSSGHILVEWPSLLDEGILDELAIDHSDEIVDEHFSSLLASDYSYLGDKVLTLPMVSLSSLEEERPHLDSLSRFPVSGFMAEFQRTLTAKDTGLLRSVYFPEPTQVPESNPLGTAIFLLDRVQEQFVDLVELNDLLKDFQKIILLHLRDGLGFETLLQIEENIHGLEQYMRRGRLRDKPVSESVMRDLGIARRYVRMARMDVRE
jgi:uncharacterized lipoprotein YddW (UPF0748 family)